MYEIWSLGHKPFEDCDGRKVMEHYIMLCLLMVHAVFKEA